MSEKVSSWLMEQDSIIKADFFRVTSNKGETVFTISISIIREKHNCYTITRGVMITVVFAHLAEACGTTIKARQVYNKYVP